MNLFQLVFVPFCVVVALLIFARTARGRITRRQGALWTLVWLAAGALIAWPEVSIPVAHLLGITTGANLIFYLAILAGMLALIYFQNRYRRLEILVTQLIRRDAIEHAERGGENVAR